MSTLVYLAIPWFIVTMLLEWWRLTREVKDGHSLAHSRLGYESKDTRASLTLGFGNVVVSFVVQLGTVALYQKLYEHRLFDLGTGPSTWVLLFFVEDFTYYWWHRASHELRFMWAAHVNHHSSERFNLSTALRQSWTTPFTIPLVYFWLPLLGFPPVMILTQIALSLLYQYWIHTELVGKLGPLEWVFNTPSHHRVHHGSNVQYLDRNHAGILIVWDRLFGTFAPEEERVVYGLTTNIRTYRPVQIAFHEWAALISDVARAPSLRTKLAYLFMPPGWSADKSTLTANEMRTARAARSAQAAAE